MAENVFNMKKVVLILFLQLIGFQIGIAQDNTAKFQLADMYIRAGQYDKAQPILEDLHQVEPTNYSVYDKLREVYVALKQFDAALRIVDKQIQRYPNPSVLAEKGLIYFKMGKLDESKAVFESAIQQQPQDRNTYQILYYTLYRERLFEQCIEILEKGRQNLQDSTAFRIELGYAYGFTGRHKDAIISYLDELKATPQYLSTVKAQLSQMSQQDQAVAIFVEETERAVRQNPMNRELRELVAWLYLEKGDYTKALDANRAISRLNQDKGLALFLFAQTALNAEYFDVARAAYESVIQTYPQEPLAVNAREGLFELLIKQSETAKEVGMDAGGKPQEAPYASAAIAAGKDILQTMPNHPNLAEIWLKIAKLYQNTFGDLTAAEASYREVLKLVFAGSISEESEFALAEIDLMRNHVAGAKIRFTRLYERTRTGLLAERTQLELAKISFYEGKIASAFTLLDAMDANTTTDVSNDAIRLKVLLRENKGPDSLNTALTEYGKAKLFERQRRGWDALLVYDQLLKSYPEHKLVDEIKFDRAALLRQMGRVEEALIGFNTLRTEHADSYLADQALFLVADTYENILHEPQKAMLQYTAFLVQYPGSLLTAEVRARIRKLRGERS